MNEERKNQQAAAEPSLSDDPFRCAATSSRRCRTPGATPLCSTRFERSAYSADIKNDFDADGAAKRCQVAGRIMSKRGMGKVILLRSCRTSRGRIQLYVRQDDDRRGRSYSRFQEVRHRRHHRRRGLCVPAPRQGEITIHAQAGHAAHQVPAARCRRSSTACTIHGAALPPALCGSHRQPRGAANFVRSLSRFVRAICAAIWTAGASWRSRLPCSAPSPAARRRARSSRTTIRSTLICICALRPSCISSA